MSTWQNSLCLPQVKLFHCTVSRSNIRRVSLYCIQSTSPLAVPIQFREANEETRARVTSRQCKTMSCSERSRKYMSIDKLIQCSCNECLGLFGIFRPSTWVDLIQNRKLWYGKRCMVFANKYYSWVVVFYLPLPYAPNRLGTIAYHSSHCGSIQLYSKEILPLCSELFPSCLNP